MKEAWIKHNKAVGFCVLLSPPCLEAGRGVNVSGKPGVKYKLQHLLPM